MTSNTNESTYNDDMKGITTSNPTFELIRENDFLYVDKSKQIYDLVRYKPNNFYFVSRPRRWGKSLMCSTLHSLFEGRKDLFKGLYIYDKYDFKPYPVLHFDFNNLDLISSSDAVKMA